jgi:DNA-binding MarR family transcriptional regulator
MPPSDHAALRHSANVLGALALVLHDRMTLAIADAVGQPETGAATLSMLDNFLDEPRVGLIHQIVGLTPSGAVRLVDRLEADGYLERGPGSDARSTSLRLTAGGRDVARKVAEARADVLVDALSALTPEQQQTLDELVSRILASLIRGPGATRWTCRLCDADACGHDRGTCPVANAARERFGSG